MFEFNEKKEVNENTNLLEKKEGIDPDFEAELDNKYEKYMGEAESTKDLEGERDRLLRLKEELIKYKEARQAENTEPDDEDDYPEKVLILERRQR